ncbi:MAG: type II toxin-antitoxin system RelE/ParE family toxin [Methylococcaceae bacterium]
MIKSITYKGLEKFFTLGHQASIQVIHAKRLRMILSVLNDAKVMTDIDSPALRVQALKGNRVGFWAVTVQANWRVIFKFEDGDVYVVDYLDYH